MTSATSPSVRAEVVRETTAPAYLTRLLLNPGHRSVQSDLANSAALHRRVMSLVPDGLGRSPRAAAGVLFRLDTDGIGFPALFVQSRIAPDTGRLPTGYAEAHTRDMSALLNALRPGLRVRYRLLGNAVRRCGRNSTAGRWKQVVPLRDDEANQWWADRAPGAGLLLHTLLSHSAEPLTAYRSPLRGTARKHVGSKGEPEGNVRVPYSTTLFEGLATVNDPDAVRSALLSGVGRGKSYGCGLLSLAPAPTDI